VCTRIASPQSSTAGSLVPSEWVLAWQREDALTKADAGRRRRLVPSPSWRTASCNMRPLQYSMAVTLYERLMMTTYELASFNKLNGDGSIHLRAELVTKHRANRLVTFCTRWKQSKSKPSLKLEEIGATALKRIGAPSYLAFCDLRCDLDQGRSPHESDMDRALREEMTAPHKIRETAQQGV
jgi:hypothetical protein